MNSSAEYQAIAMGPKESDFKPKTHGPSRFLSMTHLTPAKALVLATTIVCITFATVHFNKNPLQLSGLQRAYRSFVTRSAQTEVPPFPMETATRQPSCDYFKKYPSDCVIDPHFWVLCHRCGIRREYAQVRSAAPVAVDMETATRQPSCDYFKKYPNVCGISPHFWVLCDRCGIRREYAQVRSAAPVAVDMETSTRQPSCDYFKKYPNVCGISPHFWVLCDRCGIRREYAQVRSAAPVAVDMAA